MDMYQSLGGMSQLTIQCADPAQVMTLLELQEISLHDVLVPDELTLVIWVHRRHVKQVFALCEKRGLQAAVTGRKGIFWKLYALWHRPVLLFGMVAMVLLGMYLPSRVLFIRVEGNSSVPAKLILETAADCGIRFGAHRRQVRSEKMKNALLEAMPQLQWAGVNTSGCVAVISVRERQAQETNPKKNGVGSIVSIRDGVITSITTTKGTALCKVGQAVKAGQLLISGYTDCGISIRAEQAEGEIFAETYREMVTLYASKRGHRSEILGSEKKYSLIIGKKRINFYFGSGISSTSCVKMYEENYMTLPGGFRLPVVLVVETHTQYRTDSIETEPEQNHLEESSRSYLKTQMLAGTVLSQSHSLIREDGLFVLTGRYSCREMIGQFRKEEIIKPDGTND